MQGAVAKISTEGEGDVGILQDQDQSMNQARGTNRPTGEGGEVRGCLECQNRSDLLLQIEMLLSHLRTKTLIGGDQIVNTVRLLKLINPST